MIGERKIIDNSTIVKLEFDKFVVNLLLFNSEFKTTQRIIDALENSKEERLVFKKIKEKDVYSFGFEREKGIIRFKKNCFLNRTMTI